MGKAKLWRQEKDQCLPGAKGWGGDMDGHRGIFGSETIPGYYVGEYISLYICSGHRMDGHWEEPCVIS